MPKNIWEIGIPNLGIYSTNQPTLAEDMDANLAKWVLQHPAGSETRSHIYLPVPPNLLAGNGLTIRIRWRSTATSGSVVWKAYARYDSLAQQLNALPVQASSTTTATSGTGGAVNETLISFTPTNFAAGASGSICIARDGANGSDTMAAAAEVLQVLVEWPVDGTIAKGYAWIPAQAFVIPATSGVTRSSAYTATDNGGICRPQVLKFTDAVGNYADARFVLPRNFAGSLKTYLFVATESAGGSGTLGWQIAMGAAAVGASADPSLTAQTTFTLAYPGITAIANDAGRSAVISPSAGQELCLRVARDNTDGSTAVLDLYGLLLEYAVLAKTPGVINLSPASGAPPALAATPLQAGDTNSTKVVAQMSGGQTQSVDFLGVVPSTYGSGGTLRVRWRAASASTGYAYLRADVGIAAVGAASDPALSAGTAVQSANAGSGLINELTLPIAGMVAGSDIGVRLTRYGADPNDTLTGVTIDVLDAIVEYSPA